MDVEFRQTFGGTLPAGFNVNLPTSGDPSQKTESPFKPVDDGQVKVKEVALKLAVSLVMILVFALYIGLKT